MAEDVHAETMTSIVIGDVEIPIVASVEDGEEASVEEIFPIHGLDKVPVKHESQVDNIVISGFLNEELHSQGYTLEEQKRDVKRLRKRSVEGNGFDFKDYKGHFLVENIDLPENSDSVAVEEVTVSGRYFPWPKYFSQNEP